MQSTEFKKINEAYKNMCIEDKNRSCVASHIFGGKAKDIIAAFEKNKSNRKAFLDELERSPINLDRELGASLFAILNTYDSEKPREHSSMSNY